MRDAYAVSQVRAAENRLFALVPSGALMQRAAAGLAAVCADLLHAGPGAVYGARVVVLAGTGDNGGDALYAGARLARRGAAVTVVQAGTRLHAEGARALQDAGGRIIKLEAGLGAQQDVSADAAENVDRHDVGHEVRSAMGRADLIVDGMLGIGGSGGLREPYATLAELAARARNATTVAVDLPSGIDADTGAVAGPAVRADVTVTFGAVKPGLLIDPGAGHAGVVEFVDIGLGAYLEGLPAVSAPQTQDIAALLPRPTAESDKYRRGVVGLLVGSDRYTGAALLATGGAVRGGAGMVRLVTFPNAAAGVRHAHPEVVITELGSETTTRSAAPQFTPASARFAGEHHVPPADLHPAPSSPQNGARFLDHVGRVQAWTAGSGMGTDDAAVGRLAEVLATNLPVLIDADGLTILAEHKDLLPRPAPTLLTPHAGELGRLLDADPADIEARRLEHARRAAAKLGACVLLKGSTTVVAPPDGRDPVLVNTTGTPWLATAGTGDVLAGLAGALLAQGLLPPQAAIAAAYLHGLAARLAARGNDAEREAPIGASDVVTALPMAFHAL
jgi:ADP-dependent NAD(P)H-hydrate dehydratase / NAD(P)H-hydrate epimerase